MSEPDIRRVRIRELNALDANGRPCEVCGGHMHDHLWADLDANGFAVACSRQHRKSST
jgi:hypothetical protein